MVMGEIHQKETHERVTSNWPVPAISTGTVD